MLRMLKPGLHEYTSPRYPNLIFRVTGTRGAWTLRMPDGERKPVTSLKAASREIALNIYEYEAKERAKRAGDQGYSYVSERLIVLRASIQIGPHNPIGGGELRAVKQEDGSYQVQYIQGDHCLGKYKVKDQRAARIMQAAVLLQARRKISQQTTDRLAAIFAG